MFQPARHALAQTLTGGTYLLFLLVALMANQRLVWLACLGAIAILSTFAWLAKLRRCRAITDTPTSRIGSAAQGYAELLGVCKPLPDIPLLSPARHLPCVWYRFKTYQRRGNKWMLADRGESDLEFLLDDGSGLCMLRPYEAQVLSDRTDTYTEGDIRHVEETLLAGERVYALGYFTSQDGHRAQADAHATLDRVLSEWKDDQEALHARFDRDRDGRIDGVEWSAAVDEAHRETSRRLAEAQCAPVIHSLDRHTDGKPCLITNFDPERLARRYRYWAWGHAAVALAAAAGLAFVPV